MADITTLDMLIDWNFVAQREGGSQLQGYVPHPSGNYKGMEPPNPKKLNFPENQKSGVTIATGFAIGQHTVTQIRAMPFSDAYLYVLLTPFADKRKFDACEELYRRKGLTITKPQAEDIDRAVSRSKLAIFRDQYNHAAVILKKMPLENLHFQIRTAICSFMFQYGEYGHWKGPVAAKYWTAITNQNLSEALRILLFEYKTENVYRRRREAKLYEKAGIKVTVETTTPVTI